MGDGFLGFEGVERGVGGGGKELKGMGGRWGTVST